MALDFKAQQKIDGYKGFGGTGFEETGVYTEVDELSKTIKVDVNRHPQINPQPADFGGRSFPAVIWNIEIYKDDPNAVKKVTPRLDTISLPTAEGGDSFTDFTVNKIIDEDPGGWILEIIA